MPGLVEQAAERGGVRGGGGGDRGWAAAQLLLIRTQRRTWQRRMGELLLGGARQGRAQQPKEPRELALAA